VNFTGYNPFFNSDSIRYNGILGRQILVGRSSNREFCTASSLTDDYSVSYADSVIIIHFLGGGCDFDTKLTNSIALNPAIILVVDGNTATNVAGSGRDKIGDYPYFYIGQPAVQFTVPTLTITNLDGNKLFDYIASSNTNSDPVNIAIKGAGTMSGANRIKFDQFFADAGGAANVSGQFFQYYPTTVVKGWAAYEADQSQDPCAYRVDGFW
jgi:hypothetical protein